MTISEQEIEVERLKTTVIALNAKCSIVDDHASHAENVTIKHNDSEYKRVELHSHIKTVVEKVHEDNTAHTEFQETLHANITDLNSTVEA
jgi:hypothetical protein